MAPPTSGHNVQKLKRKIRLQRAADKSQTAGKRLEKAKSRIPKKTDYQFERVFDEQTGKAGHVLTTVKRDRIPKPDGIGKKAVRKVKNGGSSLVHGKISENEKDNSAVEGAHKGEQTAEDIYRHVKSQKKSKAQGKTEKIERLEKRKLKADVNLEYNKFIDENPQLERRTLNSQMQKSIQKRRIKREYLKAKKAGSATKGAREAVSKTTGAATGIAGRLKGTLARNRTAILTVGIFSLAVVMVMAAVSSCGSILGGAISTAMSTTYISTPSEIDSADLSYTRKEMELQTAIDTMEAAHPGYDEYRYNLDEIGHNPHTLISYLSAVNIEFTSAGVESQIQAVFDEMYTLTTEDVTETRTRTVTKTGTREVGNSDGTTSEETYTYDEEEEYTVRILQVTLRTTAIEDIVTTRMDEEQKALYGAYCETKGGLQVFASPVDYYWYDCISSYYGYRKNPNTGNAEYHRGIDMAVPTGTAVYATHDGTVTAAQYDEYYGNYVVITDSEGYTTKYAHMDSLTVNGGQSVEKGTVIGRSGNTGSSTGSHLHIECLYNGEYYNPLFYFDTGTQAIYGGTTGGNTGGVKPPDSYDDETVQKLIREAEKYLGMPYTFGGTPPTSFDCSGFVCWVFSNSGVHNLPRTTAQGIYEQCTTIPQSEAKAGDIIFFTGTYNAGRPVTHVGIYCGNGIMIHCGDPIKYSSINTSYWQSHFYAFGRLD